MPDTENQSDGPSAAVGIPGKPTLQQAAELARLKSIYDQLSTDAEAQSDGADWNSVSQAGDAYWGYYAKLGFGDNPTDDFLDPEEQPEQASPSDDMLSAILDIAEEDPTAMPKLVSALSNQNQADALASAVQSAPSA